MRRENREGFTTVLNHFQAISGITLQVVLTDGDLWLAEAIQVACPSCLHFLCTWHLAKNLLRNVRSCFGNRDWCGEV
jgi:transposase-like protein